MKLSSVPESISAIRVMDSWLLHRETGIWKWNREAGEADVQLTSSPPFLAKEGTLSRTWISTLVRPLAEGKQVLSSIIPFDRVVENMAMFLGEGIEEGPESWLPILHAIGTG